MLTASEEGRTVQQLNCYSSDVESSFEIAKEFSLEAGSDFVYDSVKEAMKFEKLPKSRIKKYSVTLIVEEVEL